MKKAFNEFKLLELLVLSFVLVIIGNFIAGIFFGGTEGLSSVDQKVINLLEQEGYHDIVLEGYNPMAGSDDDFYKIGFTAVNSASNTVHGAVTGDNFKGWTIRKY